MRTYRIYYYTERFDECFDFEKEIEAANIIDAMTLFYTSDVVFKRVWRIEELPFRYKG